MLAKKIVIYVVIIGVLLSMMVLPASAADTELYYQDILPAAGYTRFDDGVKASSDSVVSPTHFFEQVTSAGWQWDARPYERTYRSFIITLRVSGNTIPSKVEFSHYTGRTVEATFVSKHGEYLQYRVDYSSNIAWVKVEGFFDKAFTGTFAIHSCIGIRDVGVNIDTVSVTQRAYIINSSTINLEYKAVEVDQLHSLPYGHISKRSKSVDWQYDDVSITIPYDEYSLDAVSEIAFLFQGACFLDGVNFQIMDDMKTPIYIEPVVEWVCEANSVLISGDHDRPIYYTQVKVDLSGYDLKDKDLRIDFHLDPTIYNDVYNFTDWGCESIILRLPVEEVPWYKVFWNWVNTKWDSVTKKFTDWFAIIEQDLRDMTHQMDDANNSNVIENEGQQAVDGATDLIPNQAEGITSVVDTFADAFSYEGTEAIIPIPALVLPGIAGVIPETVLWDGGELNFADIVGLLPEDLLLLVQSLLTIALIIYCFKELYDTISYVMTLRRSE